MVSGDTESVPLTLHVVAVVVDSMHSTPVAVDSKVSARGEPSVGVHSMERWSTATDWGGWCVDAGCSQMVSLPSGREVRHSWAAIRSGRPRRPQCRQVTRSGQGVIGWAVRQIH